VALAQRLVEATVMARGCSGRVFVGATGCEVDGLRAFELRLALLNGATKRVPITTTHNDATTLAERYLDQGQAVRVEVWGWRYHRWELVGVIEPLTRPPADDGLRLDGE
jgi:hypothetical protein